MRINLKLFIAVFIVSWGSILVRWMGDVHPLVISFYRLFFSVILLLPLAFRKNKTNLKIDMKDLPLILLAGFFLAFHFVTWISSLQMTTVGRSIFLESTHPIFAVILSLLFLKEKAPSFFLPALVIALFGMYLTVHQDFINGSHALSGDGLALLSALLISAYLLIARKISNKYLLAYYLILVYGTAALILFVLIIFLRINFLHFPASVWGLFFLLALGPNFIGHSLLNWASRKIPVYRVNSALLAESVIATILAALLLNEYPDLLFMIGGFLILVGIGWIFIKEKDN